METLDRELLIHRLRKTSDAALAAELVNALNAVRMYDEQFEAASSHMTERTVKAKLCSCRKGTPVLAIQVRRVEPSMHHVVGAQIRALWPGVEYVADVRW